MVWYILALLGAFFNAFYFALIKKFLKNTNHHILASGTFIIGSIFLLSFSFFNGLPEIGSDFYFAATITISLNIIATYLYFKALKTTQLSLAIPMISFTPIFLIFTSSILIQEIPTIPAVIGIFLIVIGSFILQSKQNSKSILEPFKKMYKNKGILYMLIVSFIFSITSVYDKVVVTNSDQFFSSGIIFLFLGIAFAIISKVKKIKIKNQVKNSWKYFILIALALSISTIFVNTAYFDAQVALVISIKRLSILFSVVLGFLLFKEKDLSKKLFGAFLMFLGVIILLLF